MYYEYKKVLIVAICPQNGQKHTIFQPKMAKMTENSIFGHTKNQSNIFRSLTIVKSEPFQTHQNAPIFGHTKNHFSRFYLF